MKVLLRSFFFFFSPEDRYGQLRVLYSEAGFTRWLQVVGTWNGCDGLVR